MKPTQFIGSPSGTVELIMLILFLPRDACWFLTHKPRVLRGILEGRVTIWFGRSGKWRLSSSDPNLATQILDRLSKSGGRA